MPASTVPVSPFRGYRFPPEIITHAVWLYHRVPAGDRSFRPVAPINLSMPYGERYRNGETISSAFVESTVNQVVSKRMVKKQQMRWAPKSAHLLLQVRTKS
jgi:transposase-like protein